MRGLAPLVVVVLALSAPAIALADQGADAQVEIYHQFRTAFDAHRFQEALPLAQKLVTITEEQYGANDRALVNPLANLGTTQYRLGDYAAAEQTYLRGIKIVEDGGAGADRLLLQPLHGLGATYFARKEYDEASVILKRALDLSRNLDGLFNPQQMQILEPLISRKRNASSSIPCARPRTPTERATCVCCAHSIAMHTGPSAWVATRPRERCMHEL
jgi:tetratricopeptide (TPR) repeat protein